MKNLLSLVLMLLLGSIISAQGTSRAAVSFRNHDFIYVNLGNYFRVVIQGENELSIDQIRTSWVPVATMNSDEGTVLEISRSNDDFIIRPTEPGIVNVTITLQDGSTEVYRFRAILLTAIAKLGIWDFRHQEKVATNVFKAQAGIYTQIQDVDINAGCETMSYEIIRISPEENAEVVINQGGKWGLSATTLIQKAKPGDRYIFTKIRYRCPGSQVDQLAETMSFELE